MSYHRSNLFGLSGTAETIAAGIATANDVSTDPYLPETICRARQLFAVEDHAAVPSCPTTPPNLPGGIGLRKAMPLLRGYVYAESNKWVYPAVIAVAVGIPIALGFFLGRASR